MKTDLRSLPKLRDGLGYLYLEHCVVEQELASVAAEHQDGVDSIPAAALGVLMLGPGTTITHAAIKNLADNGCMVVWCGEGMSRFYATGLGETRKGEHLLQQARLWADTDAHMQVVMRMYRMRFPTGMTNDLTLEQIRGMEGARVRDAYAHASQETGVPWSGRNYDRGDWMNADPVNRALSAANACLYGLCHTAIVSGGYTPGLGFVHTGKALSFVYDIGDLYKVPLTVPVAFRAAASHTTNIERDVRMRCRDVFYKARLLERILPDIDRLLNLDQEVEGVSFDIDEDLARPAPYWDPPSGDGDADKDASW
jgi:CRISP-associated protein Cas1